MSRRLLGQAPLLLAELMARVRPLSRQDAFELQNPLLRLLRGKGVDLVAGRIRELLDLLHAPQTAVQREQPGFGDRGGGEPSGGEEESVDVRVGVHQVDAERDGRDRRAGCEHDRDDEQEPVARLPQDDGEKG